MHFQKSGQWKEEEGCGRVSRASLSELVCPQHGVGLGYRANRGLTGPAHALYFLTYENVKHAMGGNEQGHHPIAGRMSCDILFM